MDWTSVAPYLVATLGFLHWPTMWIVVVVVAAFSVYRGRAALTAGVVTIVVLTFLLDAGIAGPHLDLANYGYVMAAAAILAPWIMLPSVIWPNPDERPRAFEPSGGVRRGILYLLGVPLLFGALFAIEGGLDYLDPEVTDSTLRLYTIYALLPLLLAARWIASGIWMVTGPAIARRPQLRRGIATAAVAALAIGLYDDRTIPYALFVAGDIEGDSYLASEAELDCATVDAHPEHDVLHLAGELCLDTPEAFETAHAANPLIRRIVLDSHGGNVSAGLELGRRLNDLGFDARVDDLCSSACFTVLVGARRRHIGPEGWVGVHQISAEVWAEGGRRARWPVSTDQELELFHSERGVAPELGLRASRASPDEMDFLTPEDLVTYGIGDPTLDPPWLPPEQPAPDTTEASP